MNIFFLINYIHSTNKQLQYEDQAISLQRNFVHKNKKSFQSFVLMSYQFLELHFTVTDTETSRL